MTSNKQTPVMSVSVITAAVAALGQAAEAEAAIQVDMSLVDQSQAEAIAARMAHRTPAQALGMSAAALSKQMTFDGNPMTMADGVPVSEILLAKSDDAWGTAGSRVYTCYGNCYSNCHSACHGSRSWR